MKQMRRHNRFSSRNLRNPPVLALLAALLGTLALPPLACGGQTVTVTQVTATTAAVNDLDVYRKQINELGKRADSVNTEYRDLVNRNIAGQATDAELAAKADQDVKVYEQICADVTEMDVPRDARQAHNLFISGFNKWLAAYSKYKQGYRDNNGDALEKASDLDNQAAIDVNQAVFQVNQLE